MIPSNAMVVARMNLRPGPVTISGIVPRLVRGDDEVAAAVLGVGVFGGSGVHRLFLAEADRRDAIAAHAEVFEVFLGGVGPLFAEGDIVLDAAALVAMSFDLDLGARIGLEDIGIGLERAFGGAVELKGVVA